MNPAAQKSFTDREEPKRLFLEKLTKPQAADEYRLLTFYGVGGQGKSTLLNHFQDHGVDQAGQTFSVWAKQHSEPPKYKIASVDFKDPVFRASPAAALMELRHGFVSTGIDFFRFDLAFSHYLGKSLSKPGLEEEYRGLAAKDNSLIFDLISLGSLIAPPVGPALSILTTLGRHASKLKPKNRAWYLKEGQQLAYELESLEPQALADRLPRYLGQDLTNALQKPSTPRLVIMMDTHEALWGSNAPTIELGTWHVDDWIRNLVKACPGVLFVIFGRDQLKWQDLNSRSRRRKHDYTAMLGGNQHLIGGFSDANAHLFLKEAGVDQEHIRNVIAKDAEGLPFYLDLQVDTYKTILDEGDEPDPSEFGGTLPEVIDRFLSHLGDHHKDALLVVGQARQLTRPVFELLKQRFFNGSPVDFDPLVKHSFVEELGESGQYGLHQLMQEHLYEYVKENSPSRFKAIHHVLFEYYDARAAVEDIKAIAPSQEAAFVEAAFHKEQADVTTYGSWFDERQEPFNRAARYPLLLPLYDRAIELDNQIAREMDVDQITNEMEDDHTNRLNNLANLLTLTNHYSEAELLCRQIVEIDKYTLGKMHPTHAVHLSNLATVLYKTGSYEEAEWLYRRAIKINEQTLGERHPEQAVHLSNLASLLEQTGSYEEAERLFRRAIEIEGQALNDEQTLGEMHSKHAIRLNNLANLLRSTSRQRYEEAEWLLKRAIEIDKHVLGEMHPHYAMLLNNFALLLMDTGRYYEAEPLIQDAIKIGKHVLGEMHSDYAKYLNTFARLLTNTDRYQEAEQFYWQAVKIDEQILGEMHPDYAIHLVNYANLLWNTSRYEEALRLYRQAIETLRVSLGDEHPQTKGVMSNYLWMIDENV